MVIYYDNIGLFSYSMSLSGEWWSRPEIFMVKFSNSKCKITPTNIAHYNIIKIKWNSFLDIV